MKWTVDPAESMTIMKNDIVTKCVQIDKLKQHLQDVLWERIKNDFVVYRAKDQGMYFFVWSAYKEPV